MCFIHLTRRIYTTYKKTQLVMVCLQYQPLDHPVRMHRREGNESGPENFLSLSSSFASGPHASSRPPHQLPRASTSYSQAATHRRLLLLLLIATSSSSSSASHPQSTRRRGTGTPSPLIFTLSIKCPDDESAAFLIFTLSLSIKSPDDTATVAIFASISRR
jgi:hypothetical protein